MPYYIINYEKKISVIVRDEARISGLIQEYKEIVERLAESTKNDEWGIFQDILQMMQELVRYLLRKQPELRERMGDVMGGKVLPLPSDKLREEREAGLKQGISQTICTLIETCKEFNESKDDTVLRVAKKFSLSNEDAFALVEKYWN